MSASDTPSTDHSGSYRPREQVSLVGNVVVSARPLVATRLNEAAVPVFDALGDELFRSPAEVADTDSDVETVAKLFRRLHRRGFLEWRPARDPDYLPPVSVVVTVRNDRDHLAACLDALADLEYPAYEVVIVDDGSTDGTVEVAKTHALARDGALRLVSVGSPEESLGIGESRNRGVAAAAHDVVAFTDADCRPTPEWLADLVPYLAVHDIVGGRIRPAGTGAASAYEGQNSSLDMGAHAARVNPTGDTPYLATANLVGRRAAFEAVPFPDRNVAEDVDVCWRAIRAGYNAVYTPTGVVEHDYRSGLLEVAGRRSTYGASEALLTKEYGQDGGARVGVPVDAVLTGLLTVVSLVAVGGLSMATLLAAVAVGTLGLSARVGSAVRQRHRVGSAVLARDIVRSRLRQATSAVYALCREVTRYYSLPLAVAVIFVGLVGSSTVGIVLLAGLAVLVWIPVAVEYAVHRPDSSVAGYAAYYLADHLGYQCGVYRGIIVHETAGHLDPRSRFRVTGPGVHLVVRLIVRA